MLPAGILKNPEQWVVLGEEIRKGHRLERDFTLYPFTIFKNHLRDFPGGPVVKNPPCNAGEVGSIPGQGTKILQGS